VLRQRIDAGGFPRIERPKKAISGIQRGNAELRAVVRNSTCSQPIALLLADSAAVTEGMMEQVGSSQGWLGGMIGFVVSLKRFVPKRHACKAIVKSHRF
jgi:hypothetical protein